MASRGNLVSGIFTGLVLSVVLVWLPIFGTLIAGIVAGSIAKGPRRGALAGFLAGLMVAALYALVIFWFSNIVDTIIKGNALVHALGLGLVALVLILDFISLVIITVGGFIGGRFFGRSSGPARKLGVQGKG